MDKFKGDEVDEMNKETAIEVMDSLICNGDNIYPVEEQAWNFIKTILENR